jgi:hypothetical protein
VVFHGETDRSGREMLAAIAGHPIAGVDCGSPDCGWQKFSKKNRLFFRAPWGPASRSARRGSARLASLASQALRQPPPPLHLTLHSVRVGHGRFFGEKNIPPPKNGRDAKQVPLRVRAGSERGPARRRGPGHSPARRQVEGPESGRVP